MCKASGFPIVGSVTLTDEISRISDMEKRGSVQSLYADAVSEEVEITANTVKRARTLHEQGLGLQDAYHAALAEAAAADYLLTADLKFEQAASALTLSIKVISPINFLPEVEKWLRSM
jgi:predicted nucleic acid-binding protein